MRKRPYIVTDDPADPCTLCVGWEETGADPMLDEGWIPVHVDGSVVRRMYRWTHPECDAAVAAYGADREGW